MTETLTWITAGNPSHVLPWHAPVGGRGMPPVEVTDRPNLAGSGSILELIRDGARVAQIPIIIEDDDIRAELRSLARLLSPLDDGRLVADNGGGDIRQLECRYIGGLEWVEQIPDLHKAVLDFKAWRPYWEDTTPTVETFTLGDLGTWLPWEMGTHPIRTVPDNIFAEPTIDNTGDVQAWPVWTITGPFTDVTLADELRDLRLIVDTPMPAGEQLVIDTRPGRKTVTDAQGQSRFASLDDVHDRFFGFPSGATVVSVALAGATLDSSVQLSWTRRWRTA